MAPPNLPVQDVLVDVITRYVHPQEHVLVLSAHEPDDQHSLDAIQLRRAAESASRLVRSVQLRIVRSVPAGDPPADEWSDEPESVHGPAERHTGLEPDSRQPSASRADSEETVQARSRFDSVIAFVGPSPLDWVTDVSWEALLAPTGLLIFVTHGDVDQASNHARSDLLVRTARRVGLLPLGRVRMTFPGPAFRGSSTGRVCADARLFIRPLPMPPDGESA
jgi:hypothetical protein